MIADKDRSGWIGASDASYVVGNWNTDTFRKWFLTKIGWRTESFTNVAMQAGTEFEHKILDTIPGVRKDHQILLPCGLRVNYDGDKDGVIYEVKTHNIEKPFKVSKQYWRQAQIEMYAMKSKELYIVSYGLTESDYENFFNPVDPLRIVYTKVEYDQNFIDEFLLKLNYLVKCMDLGRFPNEHRNENAPPITFPLQRPPDKTAV